jgi:MFS transporter, PAT family, solute carrier family 33 (acetyl-CoA transportor), member 1
METNGKFTAKNIMKRRGTSFASKSSANSQTTARKEGKDQCNSGESLSSFGSSLLGEEEHNDSHNYALLIALYTLQGIPMGLSASIPFLIQQKVKLITTAAAAAAGAAGSAGATVSSAGAVAASAARLSYSANAIFALCSWPFSLKLLWAPIVDAVFFKQFGRRKSWLVPVQALAGLIMVFGSNFVERELGLGSVSAIADAAKEVHASINVKGLTIFFFVLYFLMATQDIAVDGWALTMLSKKNRGRGPICNSIGQNVGYFLSFVGFLALNDAESSEAIWRPLFRLPSRPGQGLVSLGGFIRFMGIFMLVVTTLVAVFKTEGTHDSNGSVIISRESMIMNLVNRKKDTDEELDASEIGLKETYHRLWAVCKLPAVKWLFVILLTYRLPTALSDNVKFLKAVELGMSKSTTAMLSPTLILPLGIIVPVVASNIWHGHPLRQFMFAYNIRITLVPLLDALMLKSLQHGDAVSQSLRWLAIIVSTAVQTIVSSLQLNAQMTFFASRVDPAIGGTYMTLLNTAANLGGTWPASAVMYMVGALTTAPTCTTDTAGIETCTGGVDSYFPMQIGLSVIGMAWVMFLGGRVSKVAALPDDAWRTHLLNEDDSSSCRDEENTKDSKRE